MVVGLDQIENQGIQQAKLRADVQAGLETLGLTDIAHGPCPRVVELVGMGLKPFPGRRQSRPGAAPGEQRRAELFF